MSVLGSSAIGKEPENSLKNNVGHSTGKTLGVSEALKQIKTNGHAYCASHCCWQP